MPQTTTPTTVNLDDTDREFTVDMLIPCVNRLIDSVPLRLQLEAFSQVFSMMLVKLHNEAVQPRSGVNRHDARVAFETAIKQAELSAKVDDDD